MDGKGSRGLKTAWESLGKLRKARESPGRLGKARKAAFESGNNKGIRDNKCSFRAWQLGGE